MNRGAVETEENFVSLAATLKTGSALSMSPLPFHTWPSGKGEEHPHMGITPNCHHLKFNVGTSIWAGRSYVGVYKSLAMDLISPSWICVLHQWSEHPQQSTAQGKDWSLLLQEKCFTPFFPAPMLSLQQCFHHSVRHPKYNQCLKHLKTRLSQPVKCTGFNVCRSTKALSPEHLTYWQAVWEGNVFLQVASYVDSSEEGISIAVPHTDGAPCCLCSPSGWVLSPRCILYKNNQTN